MLSLKKVIFYFLLFWLIFISLNFLFTRSSIERKLAEIHAVYLSNISELTITGITIWEDGVDENGNMYFNVSDTEKYQYGIKTKGIIQTGFYKYHPFINLTIPLIYLISLCLATPLGFIKRILLLLSNLLLFYVLLAVRFTYGLKSYLATPGYNITPEFNGSMYADYRTIFLFMDKLGLILIVITVFWVLQILVKFFRLELFEKLSLS